ncbi:sensor histidine kinase [Sporofaciens musculi]|jgi:signal transduction histidine kinase|uniref:sensor histidine kinase n=1 Tax=Sporofaciens musculi TaxID=2681861 RepID=UPI0025710810|nr:sensor histidine kinase [Sporofaciens musculi]
MKMREYLIDKLLLLTLHVGCMLLLAGFLYATGYEPQFCVLILIFWILILMLWLGYEYYSRRRYFHELWETLNKMDQRYLLGELMPVSHRLEDGLYREMIRISNKAVIERIRQIEDEQKEYREYIESWVHEVKAPITSIDLMCENFKSDPLENQGDVVRRIRLENQKIENYVDMALYYARSEDVYKDYVIRRTNLGEIAVVVLKRNKGYLIQSQIQAEVDCKDKAYTDEKWIAFILNQLVLNAAKYCRKKGGKIWIYTSQKHKSDALTKHSHGVRLVVKDNGIGIKEEELGRIFEKGFTGSNGRKTERSTGMGLYLCKKLCLKLGIEIYARSKAGEGTEVILEFPISSYLSKM